VRFASVDITSALQLHNLHSTHAAACCSDCQRRLLPGETLHVYEARSLCTLCARPLEEQPLRRERIHATSVRLAVAPRAA
jgi:predicted amidophosphoribosyltransferase